MLFLSHDELLNPPASSEELAGVNITIRMFVIL